MFMSLEMERVLGYYMFVRRKFSGQSPSAVPYTGIAGRLLYNIFGRKHYEKGCSHHGLRQ